jgi:hypothetical protein
MGSFSRLKFYSYIQNRISVLESLKSIYIENSKELESRNFVFHNSSVGAFQILSVWILELLPDHSEKITVCLLWILANVLKYGSHIISR